MSYNSFFARASGNTFPCVWNGSGNLSISLRIQTSRQSSISEKQTHITQACIWKSVVEVRELLLFYRRLQGTRYYTKIIFDEKCRNSDYSNSESRHNSWSILMNKNISNISKNISKKKSENMTISNFGKDLFSCIKRKKN